MRLLTSIACLLIAPLFVNGLARVAPAQQKHFVDIEIVSSSSTGIDQNQRWLEVLGEVGADNVRMQQRRGPTRRPGIEKIENSFGTTYKITGVLDSRNRLAMPGGTFSIRDKAAIRSLIQRIRDDGAEVALAEKMAFGLTAEQLVALHEDLSGGYGNPTKGQSPKMILNEIKRSIRTPILLDSSVRDNLDSDYTLQDELNGLSHGTVLAAALRPLGLVVAPRRQQGKETEIVITDAQSVEEHWPIGWPLEMRPSEAVPNLFHRVPINIENYPLDKALGAIQEKVGVPFLFDRNSLARRGVELDKNLVSLQADKLSYQLVLQRILAQARPRMQMEVRADESGRPFVWYSAR